MLSLERILNDDRLLRAMTGLNRQAFDALLPSFAAAYEQRPLKPQAERQRAPGGGRKATLRTMQDKLFYILLYCKCYPTFDLMSVLFSFDRSCAWDWVHGLLPILEQALGFKQALPKRKVRSLEEFVERFAGVEQVIVDGIERPIQRPQDGPRQKAHYSGKKNAIPASTLLEVLDKSGSSS